MIRVVNCPQRVETFFPSRKHLFLAGGITGCQDWQQEMILQFVSHANDPIFSKVILINPRRNDFDVSDPKASDFQIEWERHHLENVDAIIFWFPCETLCPITLYELGVAAAEGTKIFVGCHPDYARRFDVQKQLSLIRSEVTVHEEFAKLLEEVYSWLK